MPNFPCYLLTTAINEDNVDDYEDPVLKVPSSSTFVQLATNSVGIEDEWCQNYSLQNGIA